MPDGEVVTRTVRARIPNHGQVGGDLDRHGHAASKLWNVGLWTIHRVWEETGDHIPDDEELCSYLNTHERYNDLHSQSGQKVLQELSEAFHSWYEQPDPDANPPGYRKQGDTHPRSTVTWKQQGFRLDAKHDCVRLSKGRNHKDSRSDFILCEYETRPDVHLSEVESVQQVRAVWTGGAWELHIVYHTRIDAPEQSGERSAGVDLGISNFAALSIGDTSILYPGNALKEDQHYFRQREYETHVSGRRCLLGGGRCAAQAWRTRSGLRAIGPVAEQRRRPSSQSHAGRGCCCESAADGERTANVENTDDVATGMADSESQPPPAASSPAAASPGDVDRALEATLLRERVAALEAHIDDLEATLAAREATIEDQRDQLAALTTGPDEALGVESPSTVWRRLLRWLRMWG